MGVSAFNTWKWLKIAMLIAVLPFIPAQANPSCPLQAQLCQIFHQVKACFPTLAIEPERVLAKEMTKGKTFFIKRTPTSEPILVEVIGTKLELIPGTEGATRFSDRYRTVVKLDAGPLGNFERDAIELEKTATFNLPSAGITEFKRNDFVEIYGVMGDAATPYFARVNRKLNQDTFEVEFLNQLGQKVTSRVNRKSMHFSAVGGATRLSKAMNGLKKIPIEFDFAEKVRFRHPTTKVMMDGEITHLGRDWIGIASPNGPIQVRRVSVFKSGGKNFKVKGRPFQQTASLEGPIEKLDGTMEMFLDGAARISSHPAYLKMAPLERVRALDTFVEQPLPYSDKWINATTDLELHTNVKNWNQFICLGGGVCRHKVDVLSSVLVESGFQPRIKISPTINNNRGHAWIEIDLPNEKGKNTTYILDPNTEEVPGQYLNRLESKEAIRQEALTEPKDSFNNVYYFWDSKK